ncbi:MAG: TraR/DksA C4-type zinc finger protein [bacterium]
MNTEKIAQFKKRLEEELKLVEGELSSLGKQDPKNPNEWDATSSDIDQSATESDEIADREEQLEENKGEIDALEPQRENILKALEKIEQGTYSTCDVCGEEIEEERLEANPSARTCKAHMEE